MNHRKIHISLNTLADIINTTCFILYIGIIIIVPFFAKVFNYFSYSTCLAVIIFLLIFNLLGIILKGRYGYIKLPWPWCELEYYNRYLADKVPFETFKKEIYKRRYNENTTQGINKKK